MHVCEAQYVCVKPKRVHIPSALLQTVHLQHRDCREAFLGLVSGISNSGTVIALTATFTSLNTACSGLSVCPLVLAADFTPAI